MTPTIHGICQALDPQAGWHAKVSIGSCGSWSTWVSKWWAISRALEGMSAPLDTVMTLQDTPSSVSRMKPSSMAPIHCLEPTKVLGLSPAHKCKPETLQTPDAGKSFFLKRRTLLCLSFSADLTVECSVCLWESGALVSASSLHSRCTPLTLWAHANQASTVVKAQASPMSTRVR